MALSVGVDLIELDRVQRIVERHGDRFLARICTPAEMALCRDRLPELAARFAAKEAVSKALGVGLRSMSAEGIGFHEVEVLPDGRGKPVVTLSGNRHASRVGLSILNTIGLSQLIAHNSEEYVKKSISLASNIDKLNSLRNDLRTMMLSSPFTDALTAS